MGVDQMWCFGPFNGGDKNRPTDASNLTKTFDRAILAQV